MDKRLTYSVVERRNPNNKEMPGKYYAQARGTAGIRELSERIEHSCTVTRADVMAVLTALEIVVSDSLANGEIVRLGELGTLQVSIGGQGSDTKDEFNTSLIAKKKILFRSGLTLARMLDGLKFERVKTYKEQKAEDTAEEGGQGV